MAEQPKDNAALVRAPVAATLSVSRDGVQLASLEDMWRFAQYVAKSGLAPKGMERAETILIAMQYGFEIGFKPLQALQSIAVINGRPCLWGDGFLARVMSCPEYVSHQETWGGEGDKYGCKCVFTRRRGDALLRHDSEFTVGDAKRAGLWGKAGPWTTNPKRMLQMRARGFAGRDGFADWLRGMQLAEEQMDIRTIDAETVTQIQEVPKLGADGTAARLAQRAEARAEPPPPEPPPSDDPGDADSTAAPEQPKEQQPEKQALPAGPGVCEKCGEAFEVPHKSSREAGIGLYCSAKCAREANP